jgi:LysM repeat protein
MLLLVAAVGLLGLIGCSRQAQVREEPTSDEMAAEQMPTPTVEIQQGGEAVAPLPGETVVSVVTPVPEVDTPAAGDQLQPASAEQSPTAEPVAPTEPVVPTEPAPSPTATEAATPVDSEEAATNGDEQSILHEVQKDETLSEIAERYGTTTEAIVAANGLSDRSNIIPGQMLRIQTSGDAGAGISGIDDSDEPVCRKKHKVKKGEWVWKIAEKYDVAPKKIMKANNLTAKKARKLQPGTVLCIP